MTGGNYLTLKQPNDEQEQDRMDLLHHVFLLVLGGRLHRAPIPKHPQRVLDLGTGTGESCLTGLGEKKSYSERGT